ncbi:signal peptidase I [Paenibacillus herberti]|uniref:Signal peptidase I n=1 Tax=Paenibacillus herberti TaxID=1619309 RepID=A0A229NWZ6_9BACL|nr:signal peptidase I [Paenibacillus herberti]OXM14337.1 signal peptidase I [Paenibacillus herberti]
MTRRSKLIGWIRYIIGLALAMFILTNAAGLSRVSGESMLPSLSSGDILLINKLSLYIDKPEYGDVVVIGSEALGYSLVKRVIATEGDSVSISDGVAYVNGSPLSELYSIGKSEDIGSQEVAEGHVFVLGDNRDLGASLDSRSPELGQVLVEDIQGYALIKLLPWGAIAAPLS